MFTYIYIHSCTYLYVYLYVHRTESRDKQCQRILSVLSDQGLLCVIKVLCDWLICQPQIINTCIQVSTYMYITFSFWYINMHVYSWITVPSIQTKSIHQHQFSLFLLVEVANFTLFLYMLQWRETKVAKMKIANLPDKLRNVRKILLAKSNVSYIKICTYVYTCISIHVYILSY